VIYSGHNLYNQIDKVYYRFFPAGERPGHIKKGLFVNFESFVFHPQIKAGIDAAGYSTPTPIQEQTIPAILAGQDVLGLAQTGTGKTAAFVLPILQRMLNKPRGKLHTLILSPTRELAEQTNEAILSLGSRTPQRSQTIYGGVSAGNQIRGLRAGAQIAVACPGRLLDLMEQGFVSLHTIEVLVLDEADMMFDMGFLPSIRRILAALPSRRQTLLFSATMPAEIRGLATELLRNPTTVEISSSRPIETVSHAIYPVDPTRKTEMLMALLGQTGDGQVLIFTRTKHRAKKLAEVLVNSGHAATSLQGNLSQNRRKEAMDGFRSGHHQIMVATDIAARGIDVSQITHVINFDLPDTAEAYTHRIGRTGRMTRLGTAFSLVTYEDQNMVRTIERLLGEPLERRKVAGIETGPAPANRPDPVPPTIYRAQRRPMGRSRGPSSARPARESR
jgi:ATP-dependent RNA helicase RhlE